MSTFQYDDGGRADAGFRGDTGDCVVRAITIAGGYRYQDVYDSLNSACRARYGNLTMGSAREGVHRKVYDAWLRAEGWTWTPTMSIGSGCQVHLRADQLPAGRLIARLSRHLCAVVDGVIRDTHDPSRDGTRCVYGYYQPGLDG